MADESGSPAAFQVTVRSLDRLALWLMHASVVASIFMQLGKDDFLPPKVSMSQYGVGPFGWTFTVTLFLLAGGSLAMAWSDVRRLPRPPRAVTIMTVVWAVCIMLTAMVPADPDLSQPTITGRVHTLVASLALIVLPIAAVIRVTLARRLPPKALRVVICMIAIMSELSLIMLVVAAFGDDITGLGAHTAWAVYESSSVVLDVVLVYLLCAVARVSVVVPDKAASAVVS